MDSLNSQFSSNIEGVRNKTQLHISSTGKILIALTGGIALGISLISAPFISPALRKICLPYVPATQEQISNVIRALKGRTGTLLDLGSGDGRIVIETAKNKFISEGVELNFWLVMYSRLASFRNGLSRNTKFFRKDLWKHDISKYNNIVIFGVEQMMPDLEMKIQAECNNDCNIVACRFPLPNMIPINTIGHGVDKVWIYSCKKS